MKKTKLLKELKKYGWYLSRQGANHEIWENGNGDKLAVGRHADIPEPTAKAIIHKAKACPGGDQK